MFILLKMVQSKCTLTYVNIPHLHKSHDPLFAPQNFAKALFSISLGTAVLPRRNEKQRLCKICGEVGGGHISCITGDVQVACRAFSLAWPASVQIYCNKRKRLHKKRVQLPQDWFGTPMWPSFYCFGTPIWPPWSPAVLVKTRVWVRCLVSRAHKTWSRSFLFRMFLYTEAWQFRNMNRPRGRRRFIVLDNFYIARKGNTRRREEA